jgi:hypothetical protein
MTQKLDPYISELLYDHNCVIVTDLGGFVANYQPCTHNSKLNMASPPSKRIAFNSALRNNDGLLANHISEKEALNYAEACDVIRQYVDEVQGKLSKGDRIDIEKVGMLFLNKDNQIEFSPDNSSSFLKSSFGLSPVHSPAIRKDIEKANLKSVTDTAGSDSIKPAVKSTRKWKVIEIIPAAAILATLIITPPVLDKFNTNLGTLLPFSRINEFYYEELKGAPADHSARKVTLPAPSFRSEDAQAGPERTTEASDTGSSTVSENSSHHNYDDASENIVADQPSKGMANSSQEHIDPAGDETAGSEAAALRSPVLEDYVKSYHIIGGCFRIEENALRFVEQMNRQGADARIIGQNNNGLYMVSLFNSGSIATIHDTLPEFRTRFIKGAWVTRR